MRKMDSCFHNKKFRLISKLRPASSWNEVTRSGVERSGVDFEDDAFLAMRTF